MNKYGYDVPLQRTYGLLSAIFKLGLIRDRTLYRAVGQAHHAFILRKAPYG